MLSRGPVTESASTRGSEVFNNYGAKSNDELLLGYGFVLPGNPEDFVSLKMGTSAEDSRPSEILEAVGLSQKKAHYVTRAISELPGDVLAQLRVLVADDDELESLHKEHAGSAEDGTHANGSHVPAKGRQALTFVSWPNELEMLESLGEMLAAKSAGMQDALERTKDAAASTHRPAKRARPEAAGSDGSEGVREHIREMIEVYLTGELQSSLVRLSAD